MMKMCARRYERRDVAGLEQEWGAVTWSPTIESTLAADSG
jgi:hypothetical protein